MKNALVTTTIQIPHNLEAYARDIAESGTEDACIVVAGDQNGKGDETREFLASKVAPHCSYVYLDVFEQVQFLDHIKAAEYKKFLPWSCVQRRNVAILYAHHMGAEIIATVDDDNLLSDKNYFGHHGNNMSKKSFFVVNSDWFNVCEAADPDGFYPRGFSFSERGKKNCHEWTAVNGRIVVNAGLWIGSPDIDAVTRISHNPNVTGYESWINGGNLVLGKDTKCPFNSQNTALHRDVIPAYCLATGVGRYDDIIASYMVSRIAHHLGDYISFGRPIVHQVRNQHDLFRDLDDELLGMRLIDRIVDWLYGIQLTKTNYKDCTAELILEFEQRVNDWVIMQSVPSDQVAFLRSIITNYRHWMAVT